jgi:hypothetical protein
MQGSWSFTRREDGFMVLNDIYIFLNIYGLVHITLLSK